MNKIAKINNRTRAFSPSVTWSARDASTPPSRTTRPSPSAVWWVSLSRGNDSDEHGGRILYYALDFTLGLKLKTPILWAICAILELRPMRGEQFKSIQLFIHKVKKIDSIDDPRFVYLRRSRGWNTSWSRRRLFIYLASPTEVREMKRRQYQFSSSSFH